jgi:hypothetical protein
MVKKSENGPWLKHGTGTSIWSDGSKYEGDWEYDKITGEGTFTYANGDLYEG